MARTVKRHRRRGGAWYNPLSWFDKKPEDMPPAKVAEAVAPIVPSPAAQADALGTASPSASSPPAGEPLGPDVGGKRRRRKHHSRRKTRRHSRRR